MLFAPGAHHGAQGIAAVGVGVDLEGRRQLRGQPVGDGIDAQAAVGQEAAAVVADHVAQRQRRPLRHHTGLPGLDRFAAHAVEGLGFGLIRARPYAQGRPFHILFAQAQQALHPLDAPVALQDGQQVFADGLGQRYGRQRVERIAQRVGHRRVGAAHRVQAFRVGLDVEQLALRRGVAEALRQRFHHVAEGFVVEVAAVAVGPVGPVVTGQHLGLVGVEIGLPVAQRARAHAGRQTRHAAELHGLESEGEGRGAARRKGQEGVVAGAEIVARRLAIQAAGVAEVEALLVAALHHHLVVQAQRHRRTGDVGGGDVKVQVFHQR